MTYRTLLVDDERLARVVLRDLLRAHEDVAIVGEAARVDAAEAAIGELDPDLVFLDVQMPGGLGTTLFDAVDVRGHVVFVTAYDQFAVRAFELNALDYLLKPVEPERLAQCLARVRERGPQRAAPDAAADDGPLHADALVCLPRRGGMRFFHVRDITHVSAADDYATVHLADGSDILSTTSLKDWETRLPEGFLRVHRSHLVQVAHLRDVVPSGSAYEVRLQGGGSVPMSRRRGAALLAQLRADRGR